MTILRSPTSSYTQKTWKKIKELEAIVSWVQRLSTSESLATAPLSTDEDIPLMRESVTGKRRKFDFSRGCIGYLSWSNKLSPTSFSSLNLSNAGVQMCRLVVIFNENLIHLHDPSRRNTEAELNASLENESLALKLLWEELPIQAMYYTFKILDVFYRWHAAFTLPPRCSFSRYRSRNSMKSRHYAHWNSAYYRFWKKCRKWMPVRQLAIIVHTRRQLTS